MRSDIAGPYTVWTDYGCEGWKPSSYATLAEAVEARRHGDTVIMRPVKVRIVEDRRGIEKDVNEI